MKKPLDSFDASEDFFVLVVECHYGSSCLTMLGMKSISDTPSVKYAPDGVNTWILPGPERKKILQKVVEDVVEKYVDISYNCNHDPPVDQCSYLVLGVCISNSGMQ